jgi:hypothetical protein
MDPQLPLLLCKTQQLQHWLTCASLLHTLVQVSKAVYDEASQLYNTLLPLIADFEQEHPDGRICFTVGVRACHCLHT